MSLYLERYAYPHKLIPAPASENLGISVVIPCYNEPNLIASLESLWENKPTSCDTEVLVIINYPQDAPVEVIDYNRNTYEHALNWAKEKFNPRLTFHFILEALPAKKAGVGLARKIGMDEAARRFEAVGNSNGIIVGFDADSLCSNDYLASIEAHFNANPLSPGASIYYEHPTDAGNKKLSLGITQYELHLRYYVHAQRFTGFPHAYQTVGSSMAVRSDAYQKQGGMNTRKAGEDFYFLHRIIPLGGFTEITSTRVIPSPRVSDRVPFGTGKAMGDYIISESEELLTYNPRSFEDLKQLFDKIEDFYDLQEAEIAGIYGKLPQSLISFISLPEFRKKITEIQKHSTNLTAFKKHFYSWFSAFMILKYVHHARDNHYANIPVESAARQLLKMKGKSFDDAASYADLLATFRSLDRKS